MLPILLSFLEPSSIYQRLTHCSTFTQLLTPWFCRATELDLRGYRRIRSHYYYYFSGSLFHTPSHRSLHRHLPAQPSHPFDRWRSCWFGCVALLSLIFQWGNNVNWFAVDFIRFHSALFWRSFHTGICSCFGARWFNCMFPEIWQGYNVAVLELYPIVAALELWGQSFATHSVLFLTDNQAVVEVIYKQSARNNHLMRLLRRLVVTALKFNVYFKAKYILGKTNVIADRLSRFQEFAACQAAPWLHSRPDPIPPELLPWRQWCCVCSMQLWQRAHGILISMLSLPILPLARPIFLLPLFSPPP